MTVEEAASGRTPMGAVLADGVKTLSLNQTIEFRLFTRLVLPLDGFVYWVDASLMSQQSFLAAIQLNPHFLGSNGQLPKLTIEVQGSLHYATDSLQEEDATYAKNSVVFTSLSEVQNMNFVGSDLIYIAEFDGIRFAFNSRGSFYQQADLWHYRGDAIYSVMDSQIITDPRKLKSLPQIVSNSLPAWLALNVYAPTWPVLVPLPGIPLYPSFLSPQNLPPIYGTVHIDPESTTGLQSAPYLNPTDQSHYQLSRDLVTVTLYGASNDLAMNFLDWVNQYSLDTDALGIMNVPIVRDDKKTQSELSILAAKKRIIFEVSYYQKSIRNIVNQLIDQCVVTFIPEQQPLPPNQLILEI